MIGLGIIVGIIIVLISISVYYFYPSEDRILNFISENLDKTSISIIKNDSLIVDINSSEITPLASTVKIILAIEYAEQAADGLIDPDEMIPLIELEKFHVKNTDGGAHPAWLNSLSKKDSSIGVPVREIAKGMIRYSSNANTEWLSKKLGLENINSRLDSVGISNHTEIYYIVSALFVRKELFPDLNGTELVQQLRELSEAVYIDTINSIHLKLSADTTYRNQLGDLPMNVQEVWSDRLPASTTSEYANLMKKLNSKTYFSDSVHVYLDEVMEGLMESKANQELFSHAGMKGGSTAFVLTKAMYATDKEGNTFSIAYFLNDLSMLENTRLSMSMNSFELALLSNDDFLEKLTAELN